MDWTELGAWQALLRPERWDGLMARVEQAYAAGTVYPPRQDLFAAFRMTPPEQVRVVILGQDPYHEPGQANGLAFSVSPGVPLPPSLRNIYQELRQDLGLPAPPDGDLRPWARQGVFLLNSVLSVERGRANSHRDWGWQALTDAAVEAVAQLPQPVAFVLWGAQAQKKRAAAQASPHPRLVLCAPHPSPLSSYRGFFGSRPFSQVNAFLRQNGQTPIDWSGTAAGCAAACVSRPASECEC